MSTTESVFEDAYALVKQAKWSEAELLARRVLRDKPIHAAALCIVGSAHFHRGDEKEAYRLYREAIYYDPTFVPPYRALAETYYILGRPSEAAEIYRRWLRVDPSNPEVTHMLAAVTSHEVPDGCSESYVRIHFDQFAQSFDEVLINRLAYRGPDVIGAALAKQLGEAHQSLDILDAGCGTGLCGPAIRAYSRKLTGIDLSEKMIEQARQRSCYDQLIVSELFLFMQSSSSDFDVIVSSDVFVYMGELHQVIVAAHRALRLRGLLIFTVEALDGPGTDGYRIQASGRYAHRHSYLCDLLSAIGFDLINLDEVHLRSERGKKTPFFCAVAQKRDAKPPARAI